MDDDAALFAEFGFDDLSTRQVGTEGSGESDGIIIDTHELSRRLDNVTHWVSSASFASRTPQHDRAMASIDCR